MFSFIDLDKLLDMLDAYKQSDESMIACTLITPCQCVHAYLTKPEMRCGDGEYKIYHDDILNYMLGEMYDIGAEINMDTQEGRIEKQLAITEEIPYREDNFVNLRYAVSSQLTLVSVSIPFYVTKKQYEDLVVLNERLKKAGIEIYVTLSNYNPIKSEQEATNDLHLDDRNPKKHLDIALRILKLEGRIVDYDLPFGGECIIESKSQLEEKTV